MSAEHVHLNAKGKPRPERIPGQLNPGDHLVFHAEVDSALCFFDASIFGQMRYLIEAGGVRGLTVQAGATPGDFLYVVKTRGRIQTPCPDEPHVPGQRPGEISGTPKSVGPDEGGAGEVGGGPG